MSFTYRYLPLHIQVRLALMGFWPHDIPRGNHAPKHGPIVVFDGAWITPVRAQVPEVLPEQALQPELELIAEQDETEAETATVVSDVAADVAVVTEPILASEVTLEAEEAKLEKNPEKKPEKKVPSPLQKAIKWLLNKVLLFLMVAGVFAALILVVPLGYYYLVPTSTTTISSRYDGTPIGGSFANKTQQVSAYQPPVDTTLPEGRWISIPRIGVRTELLESTKSDEALDKGVWMVPGYGQPGDQSQPLIVAAHRYGWNWWWKGDYWKYHSFYLLPELEPGDRVEIIAGQRKWVYEIYAGGEGEEITDYEADLILYTCKFLNSPVRHFRYARLIDPTTNTQE